jgi:uncharacterized OsmC-like protein
MKRETLHELQAPLKQRYRDDPSAARVTLRADGRLHDNVSCSVAAGQALVKAGLHSATGGDGSLACSGDMLLHALVACAGVTLSAVATSLGIELKSGHVAAEGDLDFRGTLGVAKDAPVGFKEIRVFIDIETDADLEKRDRLLQLTERYCVVYQTLRNGAHMGMSYNKAAKGET